MSEPETTELSRHTLIQCVILGLIAVVSLVGNVIVVGTLIAYRQMRIPIYVVIGGLALADLISVGFDIPNKMIQSTESGEVISVEWCKAVSFLANSALYVAAYHLVVLGVLRGILLTDRGHTFPTSVHAFITSVVLWVVVLLVNITTIQSGTKDSFLEECVVKTANTEQYIILFSAFSFFLPLLLIFIIYLVTSYIGKRFFEDSYSRRERRMSKLISVVIITFALCHLPYQLVDLMIYYKNKDIRPSLEGMAFVEPEDLAKVRVWMIVRSYLGCLSHLDLAIRPVAYATLSTDLGESFDEVINCYKCRKNTNQRRPKNEISGNLQIEEPLTAVAAGSQMSDQTIPESEIGELD